MLLTPRKYRLPAIILVLALIGFGIFYLFVHPSDKKPPESKEMPEEAVNSENDEKIPEPSDIITLSDSSRIFVFHKVSLKSLQIPGNRYKVKMDGDLFFDISDRPGTFTVHTRLLDLSITGKAAFRVIAYSKEEGEEVQVLYGHIVAKKSYKSDFPEPETLGENSLLMINRSIDLMEKEEKLDTRNLRKWWKTRE